MSKLTICDIIAQFMSKKKDRIAAMPEIYQSVYDYYGEKIEEAPAQETIRAAIYRAPKKYDFKRIGKGIYFLQGENTSSIIINGDSRKMPEIEDKAITGCIIDDHPWKDTKAHKSGNQKCFADYDTFEYTVEDFKEKARVLDDGCFLAEFLPVESATNWKYLTRIKQMAEEAGFQYYCQMIWRKAAEGEINTGRTTKGVEQIIIFSKGKPRRLAPAGKPYMTNNMLSYEVEIPANKGKEKNHQAEKPLRLYEYLIENLTNEDEVCLDQFGGACNLAQACINKSRWGIVYELSKDFVKKAIDRLGFFKVYEPDESNDIEEIEDNTQTPKEVIVIKTIPANATDFQFDFLGKVLRQVPSMLSDEDIAFLNSCSDKYENACRINDIFEKVNANGYEKYARPSFELDLATYATLQPIYDEIKRIYEETYDEYIRSANLNFKLEMESYAEYAVTKQHATTFEDLRSSSLLNKYFGYIKEHYPNLNLARTMRLLNSYFVNAA